MEKISNWLLDGNNLAYAMSGLIGAFILAYFVYNTFSFVVLKERYHGIRFTTKNIAYITMFTAINVSVTVVISLTIPITVFPPIRIAFEGVMVKITGFIFGPIIGVLVALITEVLVMIFVPSFIHPAFIIVVISFGFIAGIGSSLLRLGKGYNWANMLLINLFFILFSVFILVIIDYFTGEINIFGIKVTKEVYKWFFAGSTLTCLFFVWVVYFSLLYKKNTKSLHVLLPIILFASASEYLSTSIISAWGDAGFLGIDGSKGYSAMLISRLVQAPLKILFNATVLYFTYKAVHPLIKRDR
ncbi:ECF transporter S component [Spiroplasma turonicum]|uniref:ECF transporter S component n=1 Tax=Spiroplasma turonicum TaxID=216946 RepID=A0A0K1P4P6_9MOLU|nr:ECF transporter S component [Spiroplasma turonicum]AKU79275.1 hypothetical protein STURON_0029 [Spiroplasma turonicum]ALX70298.1 hypothetical protein STURO_v1c00290 [Spiroplasma turonicum]